MQWHFLSGPVHLVSHAIGDIHRLLFGNCHQIGVLEIKSREVFCHNRIVLGNLAQFLNASNPARDDRI